VDEELLFSRRAAARKLGGLSVRTVDNLVACGELHPRRVGRRVFFEGRELERFARRDHATQPAGERDGR